MDNQLDREARELRDKIAIEFKLFNDSKTIEYGK